ncbi:MAG TPA: class I SAM-dependent methyltransferase [Thermoanaerobaculia bacterium]|nr:class I SAM-dependent methyltransferase [Thermoanaerobaculia bacterium]
MHDFDAPEFVDAYDELPLWSAMFGALLLQHVPLHAGMTVLDVGCGSGFPLLELSQRLGPNSRAHGLDPWHAAVRRAERKRKQWNVHHAALRVGDAARMPFRSRAFDLVVSNLGVNNFADARASLLECRRVLRDGGTLALTTNLVGHMRELYDVFAEVVEDRAKLDAHVKHRATLDGLHTLLAECGFTTTRVFEDTFVMRYANAHALFTHDFIRFGFMPAWQEFLSAEDFARVEAQLNGPLTLTIPRAYIEAT